MLSPRLLKLASPCGEAARDSVPGTRPDPTPAEGSLQSLRHFRRPYLFRRQGRAGDPPRDDERLAGVLEEVSAAGYGQADVSERRFRDMIQGVAIWTLTSEID